MPDVKDRPDISEAYDDKEKSAKFNTRSYTSTEDAQIDRLLASNERLNAEAEQLATECKRLEAENERQKAQIAAMQNVSSNSGASTNTTRQSAGQGPVKNLWLGPYTVCQIESLSQTQKQLLDQGVKDIIEKMSPISLIDKSWAHLQSLASEIDALFASVGLPWSPTKAQLNQNIAAMNAVDPAKPLVSQELSALAAWCHSDSGTISISTWREAGTVFRTLHAVADYRNLMQ